eukprot:7390643-Prymnesium_polylepis.1
MAGIGDQKGGTKGEATTASSGGPPRGGGGGVLRPIPGRAGGARGEAHLAEDREAGVLRGDVHLLALLELLQVVDRSLDGGVHERLARPQRRRDVVGALLVLVGEALPHDAVERVRHDAHLAHLGVLRLHVLQLLICRRRVEPAVDHLELGALLLLEPGPTAKWPPPLRELDVDLGRGEGGERLLVLLAAGQQRAAAEELLAGRRLIALHLLGVGSPAGDRVEHHRHRRRLARAGHARGGADRGGAAAGAPRGVDQGELRAHGDDLALHVDHHRLHVADHVARHAQRLRHLRAGGVGDHAVEARVVGGELVLDLLAPLADSLAHLVEARVVLLHRRLQLQAAGAHLAQLEPLLV